MKKLYFSPLDPSAENNTSGSIRRCNSNVLVCGIVILVLLVPFRCDWHPSRLHPFSFFDFRRKVFYHLFYLLFFVTRHVFIPLVIVWWRIAVGKTSADFDINRLPWELFLVSTVYLLFISFFLSLYIFPVFLRVLVNLSLIVVFYIPHSSYSLSWYLSYVFACRGVRVHYWRVDRSRC